MADAKHTPGPWKATIGISETDAMRCGVTAVRGKVEYLLATIENGAPGDFCDTEEANAHLIAGAPDLLEAAQFAYAAMDSDEGRRRARASLIAAIAKATGAA